MKFAKVLGFSVAAVLAVMAMSAASASATKICSANQTGSAAACTSGFLYGTDILSTDTLKGGLITKSVLKAPGLPEIVCESAGVGGGIHSDGTAGSITELSFSKCVAAGLACTVTTATPYEATASNAVNETGSNGTLTVTIPLAKAISIVCGTIVKCSVSGTAKGSLYNPENEKAPGGKHSFATANFTATSGSKLTGCGTGEDTYTSGYEINPTAAGAGALHIE